MDADKDGQISLAEWRKSGKSYAEFQSFDRNNDGFITVEEMLFAMKITVKGGTGGTNVASGPRPGDPSSQFNRGQGGFGPQGGGGNGKGGFPGGGKKGGKGGKGGKGKFGGGDG
jgi:hypothetical protein